ncbi:MAG: hypothetical protein H6Q10_1093 [Acidobacteria bacterium]|nr:hypothetical protein [Acidobacteriota bacterium]
MKVARHAPVAAALALLASFAVPAPSAAQVATQAPARVQPQGQARIVAGQVLVVNSTEAAETRSQLLEILSRYSPSLGQVLRLDPSLLSNADYLAPYPALAQFLAQHPEVARDPAYFFESVEMPSSPRQWDDTDREREFWRETFAAVMLFVGFLFLAGILSWLIRTLLDYRRWLRLSKIQADAHNKLLDRFAANEELLGYVQSEAGRRFLASSPLALDAPEPASPAPVRRILWAVEAGCVLAAAGAGLLGISRQVAAVSQPMLALGLLATALGGGFVLAAGVSYVLSRRLGLIAPGTPAERTPPAGV